MSNDLIPSQPNAAALAPTVDRARTYAANAKASSTRSGYASDWQPFQGWCASMGLSYLPADPQSVALYIADMAKDHKPATIGRHMAAIAARHKATGYGSRASLR